MITYTLAEIAQFTKAKLIGNPDHIISRVASLEEACDNSASFLANNRYRQVMKQSKAGVICVNLEEDLIEGKNFLVSRHPSYTFQAIIHLFSKANIFTGFVNNSTCPLHPTAKIDSSTQINPLAVIDQNVTIGKHSFIGSHVYIGPNVTIGDHCRIHPGVIIRENTQIQNRVIIQPNAVIGSCGFGYITDQDQKHQKLDQIGNVVIEDDVEIGANTTIDRARFSSTIIRKGTKIDNLVQIAHNCDIGSYNLMAAQTGVAGSAKTGSHVYCGGQVGILGHVEIADQTQIATRSGVSKSLPSGRYRGSPAIPIEKYNRQKVYQRKIEFLIKKAEELENKIKELEKNKS